MSTNEELLKYCDGLIDSFGGNIKRVATALRERLIKERDGTHEPEGCEVAMVILNNQLQSAEAKLAVMDQVLSDVNTYIILQSDDETTGDPDGTPSEEEVALMVRISDARKRLPERAQRLQEFLISFEKYRRCNGPAAITLWVYVMDKWRAYQGDSDG